MGRRKRVRKRTHRVMPRNLQIRMFTHSFLKANRNYADPEAELDRIEPWDYVSPDESYRENLETLKKYLHQYRWEIPKKKKKKTSTRDLRFWDKRGTDSLEVFTTSVTIKRHEVHTKRKNKSGNTIRKYKKLYGRIQLTVPDKAWIGREAKIIVRIPKQ